MKKSIKTEQTIKTSKDADSTSPAKPVDQLENGCSSLVVCKRQRYSSSSDEEDESNDESTPSKKKCNSLLKRSSDEEDESNGESTPSEKKCNSPDFLDGSVDWQCKVSCVKERLSLLYHEKHLWDVKFKVGTGSKVEEIFSHQLILSASSPVFQKTFAEGWLLTQGGLEVLDIEPAPFKIFLKFLYSDETSDITSDNIMAVLYAAKKYQVPSLEKHCGNFLKENVNSDNAFALLTQAKIFEEEKIMETLLEKIDVAGGESISAEEFTNIDEDTLCTVLERNTLAVCEIKLFEAVERWSEAECIRQALPVTSKNKRQVAEKALSLIRFPLMSGEEFAAKVVPSRLLPDKDIISLFLYFNQAEKPPIYFDSTPRALKELMVVNRFEKVQPGWKYFGFKDEITFNVDCDVFLAGFGLYGSECGPGEYKVRLEIMDAVTENSVQKHHSAYKSDGSRNTARVFFEYPIKLAANKDFTASVDIKGPPSFHGIEGQDTIVQSHPDGRKVTVTFKTTDISYRTRRELGQIPEILFYL